MLAIILKEIKEHSPFTAFGTLTGIIILSLMMVLNVPRFLSEHTFWLLHPAHVFFSAWVTAGIYWLYSSKKWLPTLIIGYIGSVGIGTLSDCLIPYAGELLLDLPHAHHHIGFIEKWWIVNPLAISGAMLGIGKPLTKEPHAGHVLLSTWASLFHVMMAIGGTISAIELVLIGAFLFVAVLLPCCVSDIIFPLVFIKK
jgi:hypothetical protein